VNWDVDWGFGGCADRKRIKEGDMQEITSRFSQFLFFKNLPSDQLADANRWIDGIVQLVTSLAQKLKA
jgi:hypothetical protein